MPRGRLPVAESARMEVVCTRFTQNELQEIDDRRGDQSRSAFIRDAVKVHLAR